MNTSTAKKMNAKNQSTHHESKDTVDAVCDTVELHYRDKRRCIVDVAATEGGEKMTASGTRFVGFFVGKRAAKNEQEKTEAIIELNADACGLLRAALALCDMIAESAGNDVGAEFSARFIEMCAREASAGSKLFRVVAVDGGEKEWES